MSLAPGRVSARARLGLIPILIGTGITVLDTGLANIALPSIAARYDIAPGQAIWVAVLHQLVTAVLIIPAAGLGQRFGTRNIYITALALVAAGSLICLGAPDFPTLLAARAVQGAGTAGVVALGMVLVRQSFSDEALGPVIGLYAMVVAICNTAAPLAGAVLLGLVDLHWLFVVPLLPALLSAALAPLCFPNHGQNIRLDYRGFVLAGIFMASFLLSVQFLGIFWPLPLAGFALAAVFLWLFIRSQRHSEQPAIALSVFRSPRFCRAISTAFLGFVAITMITIAVVFRLEMHLGLTPLEASVILAPWAAATAVTAPLASSTLSRFAAPATLVSCGLVTVLLGALGFLAAFLTGTGLWGFLAPAMLCGAGFGLTQTPNNREMLGSVPVAQSGAAAAMLATSRTIAMALGAALAGFILSFPQTGQAAGVAILVAILALILAMVLQVVIPAWHLRVSAGQRQP